MKQLQFICLIGIFTMSTFSLNAQFKEKHPVDKDFVPRTDLVFKNLYDSNKSIAAPSGSTEYQAINHFNVKRKAGQLLPMQFDGNRPSYIKGRIPHQKNDDLQSMALEYLEAASYHMSIQSVEGAFKLNKEWKDDLGISHLKMQQQYNGVDVYGKEIIMHADERGFFLLNGNYADDEPFKKMNFELAISDQEIQKTIKGELDAFQESHEFAKNKDLFPEMEQWQINKVILEEKDDYQLAYHVKVYANLAEYYTFFLDAANGNIIKSYTNICKFHDHGHGLHAEDVGGPETATATDLLGVTRTINVYSENNSFYMVDAARTMYNQSASNMPDEGVGVIMTIDAFNTAPQNNNFSYDHVSSSNNNWNNSPGGVSAHFNGGQAYNYFKNVHARESISGEGGNIYSFINVAGEDGNSMGNAFWNGAAMFYGNGDAAFFPLGRGLDVAGHELSHGVVQSTANLEYYGESGAMNESFADVFGAMIDRDDWLIGEDVVKTNVFTSGALRSMEDPHNGQSSGDFGGGWQPRHTNEQYTGNQDNGGVHINSGIPNYAYYLFATNSAVGKQKAEKVFYRALTAYLTKSSQFRDLRAAVVQSADDLYDASVVNAANAAFDQVGIAGGGQVTNYEQDAVVNPGTDLLLFSTPNLSTLFIKDIATQEYIGNPLSTTDHISRPSVTDDGSVIVFTGADKKLYAIEINWSNNAFAEGEIHPDAVWRNVIISKDGRRVAALDDVRNNRIFVYDFDLQTGQYFELFNPTFSEGVETGEVLYADAMEFDITGEFIVYDANNEINSNNTGLIEYWDIGFIRVFDNAQNTFGDGSISKLFTQLPEGVSVGNPTFSKNSPYILALDLLEEGDYKMLGVNTESGDVGELFLNTDLSWPNYSKDDSKIVYDLVTFAGDDVGNLNVDASKIQTQVNSEGIEEFDAKWGVLKLRHKDKIYTKNFIKN